MKRIVAMLMCLMLPLTCLAEAAELPAFAWEHDGREHWQLEGDEEIRRGEHELDDGWRCGVCGAEVQDWGDGSFDVTDYDRFGNVLRLSSYDGEGRLTRQSVHILTLDDAGMPLRDLEYVDGVLYGDYEYAAGPEGEQIPVRQTTWNDDDTVSINEYDAHGNCVRAVVQNAEGAIVFETVSEYALNDEGWYYECRTTSRFDSGETFHSEMNQYGDQVRTINTDAEGVVWADTRYEYGYEEAVKVWSRQYSFGRLCLEETFDAEGRLVQETEYPEEGGRIEYCYNAEGDVISAAAYDDAGNAVSLPAEE